MAIVNYGFYRRYGIEKYRALLAVWPELGEVLLRETYEEASDEAWRVCYQKLAGLEAVPVRWIHHPHKEDGDDPLDLFGSWGWKTTDALFREHE